MTEINNEDLVNEILEISLNVHTDISNIPVSEAYGDKNGYAREDVVIKAKEEIRRLLPIRQELIVTRDEIYAFIDEFTKPGKKDLRSYDEVLEDFFKSKGFKVVEK